MYYVYDLYALEEVPAIQKSVLEWPWLAVHAQSNM